MFRCNSTEGAQEQIEPFLCLESSHGDHHPRVLCFADARAIRDLVRYSHRIWDDATDMLQAGRKIAQDAFGLHDEQVGTGI